MSYFSLKCPACGADLRLDDTRNTAFCEYCGTKIYIQDEKNSRNNKDNADLNDHIIPDYSKGQYTGDRVNGIPNGKGLYLWPDGVSYEGDFVNGMFCGRGKKICGNSRYEGEFRNNLYNGMGKFVDATGSVYKGTFLNNKKNGKFRSHIHFEDGAECYEDATFKDDKREGVAICRFSDGHITVSEMHNGTFNGELFIFNPNNSGSGMDSVIGQSFGTLPIDSIMGSRSMDKVNRYMSSMAGMVPGEPYVTKGRTVNGMMNGPCKAYYKDGSWIYGKRINDNWSKEIIYCNPDGRMSVYSVNMFGGYSESRPDVIDTDCQLRFSIISEAVDSVAPDCKKNMSFEVKFIFPKRANDGSKPIKFELYDGKSTIQAEAGESVYGKYPCSHVNLRLTQTVRKGIFGTRTESFEFEIDVDSEMVCAFEPADGVYRLKETSLMTGMMSCFE